MTGYLLVGRGENIVGLASIANKIGKNRRNQHLGSRKAGQGADKNGLPGAADDLIGTAAGRHSTLTKEKQNTVVR
jgi:hypothetical protein